MSIKKRYTQRDKKYGDAYFPYCFEKCGGMGCKKEKCEFLALVCEALCEYEETGLAPAEIDRGYRD